MEPRSWPVFIGLTVLAIVVLSAALYYYSVTGSQLVMVAGMVVCFIVAILYDAYNSTEYEWFDNSEGD